MTTKADVIRALDIYCAEQKDEQDRLATGWREASINLDSKQEIITGLRSIEASLQTDLKEKREVIQAQSERIIELAAYRDELKVEVEQLRRQKATDQKIVTRNLELVKEVESLTTRNEALQSRCTALDHRVQVQKDEIDSLKFAMHKAGL